MDDYTTPLSPEEQTQYQAWAKSMGKNPADEEQDYDLPGLYKATGGKLLAPGEHGPDTFKKPNHPTFSSESQYHGMNGNEGGTWNQNPDGTYNFTAGRTNLEHWGPQGLQKYFQKYEPGNRLIIPENY